MFNPEKLVKWLMPALGIGTWFYFLVICVLLSAERILHADTAYYLHTLVHGNYLFFGPRPVGGLTQWLPILLVWFKAPLAWVIMGYSVAFALLYGAVGYATYRLVPKPNTVFITSLVTVIAAGHVLFNPANEATLALLFSASFHVVWFDFRNNPQPKLRWGAPIFFVLSLLSHPSSSVLLLFSGLYAEAEARFKNFPWSQIALFGACGALLIVSVTVWGGDANPQAGFVFSMLNPDHWHIGLDTPGIAYFVRHLGSDSIFYLPVAIVFIWGMVWLASQKKLIQLLIMAFFFFLILLMNAAMYFDGESAVVMEKGILPISLMAMAFIVSVEINTRPRIYWAASIVLVLLVLWRFNTILHIGKEYTKRLNAYSEFMATAAGPKTIIHEQHPLSIRLKMTWCSGIESLYLSALRNDRNGQKTVFVKTGRIPQHWLTRPDLFLGPSFWPEHSVRELNPQYFALPATPYLEVAGQ